ncbi:MAG: hypothetical protein ABF747_08255 [Bifidobacterium sp.]|uniref:Alpha-galactosidase n=1 Tax=Bifidobacterium fermentum TaxID=3059035 RepID=A0AB39UMB1_9BIFI
MNDIDYMRVQTPSGWHDLQQDSLDAWTFADIDVSTAQGHITLRAHETGVLRIQIGWHMSFPEGTRFVGDSFERDYGDIEFTGFNPDRIYHWYWCARLDGGPVSCWGVAIRPHAWCAWTVAPSVVDLWIDVRNGDDPLVLHGRALDACTLVIHDYDCDEFEALRRHCAAMSQGSRPVPKRKVAGFNDWYFAYGRNCADLEYRAADFLASIWPTEGKTRPWVVIDDGWQTCHDESYNGGPWDKANASFGDMGEVASRLRQAGVEAGIWFRPLLTRDEVDPEWILRGNPDGTKVLDISHPAVLRHVSEDIRRFTEWGFALIKHDFTTYDILGCWGSDMDLNYQAAPLHFWNRSKTTAEIFNDFYAAIRKAAGDALLMGCNTVSHLSAGVFDLMRVGDDTSGHDFNRTRRTGVNSLAFRMPQNDLFYQCDADCVGITDAIPWELNRRWLKLLAASGTPLFISCNPDELDAGQRNDIKRAFELALREDSKAMPTDWAHSPYPEHWSTSHGPMDLEWYPTPRFFPAE